MRNRQFLLLSLIFTFLLSTKVKGQISYDDLPGISIGVGYFGELITHPGLVIYGEVALNKGRNQLLTRLNLINYRHKGHTRNHLLLPEIIFRRNTKKLNHWEASIGLGTLYQKADSRVYEFEEGAFIRKNSGWFYFAPSLGVRYGRTISLSNGNILTPNIGGRLFYQYPFNDFWLLRTAIDLSVSYQIK